MAETRSDGADTVDSGLGRSAWRKRVAILLALAMASAGLLLLERSPASAAATPHAVHSATHPAAAVSDQVDHLNTVTEKLRGTASLLTQTMPHLDAASAARTADVAASASHAASLSQQLASTNVASLAKDRVAAARAGSTADQLQAALAATQSKARIANQFIIFPIQFCTFTIVIGPIVIDVPGIIHIVIGPIVIQFRAPCFLSGLIPTHLPR